MTNWKEYKLSDLMDIIGGGTPKTKISEYWDGNIPWLSVVDFGNAEKRVFDTEKKITELGLNNSSTKILKKGQIIISARGTVGELAVLGRDMAFNQSCYGLNAKSEICTNNFLYYLMKCKISELKRNAHGAVFDTITRNTFETVSASIPDLPTQTAIAEILSSLDDKIELNNKINQELENLAQTLFKQWFIDFEFPNEKGEPYKSSGGALVDSELGEIPKGWEVRNLSEVTEISSSKRIFSKEYVEKGIPFFRGKEITELDNSNKISTELFISNERYNEIKSKFGVPKIGDILITSVGTIGNTYLINYDFDFYFKDGNITWIKNYISHLSPYFIFTWLRSYETQSNIKKVCIGSTQQALTISALNNLNIIFPSKILSSEFSLVVESLYNQISSNKNENQELTKLRDTLLPKLISGELEVNGLNLDSLDLLDEKDFKKKADNNQGNQDNLNNQGSDK